ncbi:MAG: tRNA (cytidine(34)-2'-O)-methyltransferase [Deltaproteobacteria bacterium]|nr:tRNA (cytidine(34)-2'-O)-methyltransferase [Deltaproteobacteria bacterium]
MFAFPSPDEPLLHLVLLEPRIPGNVGAIARMSVGTGCAVHVCGDVPFDGSNRQMWRAGLDYWPSAQVHFHASVERCLAYLGREPYIMEVGSDQAPWDVAFKAGDVVVLGPEDGTVHLPEVAQSRVITLPTQAGVRSLNLAQCAAVVAFEAMRQTQLRQK